MKIAIASDHAAYEEKDRLKPLLDELGNQYEDLGTVATADQRRHERRVNKIREIEREEIAHLAIETLGD